MGYSYLRYYNTKREHAGDNLDGKIPIEYAQEIMPKLDPNIALFPPVILDNLSSSSYWKGGKDVCEHYISRYTDQRYWDDLSAILLDWLKKIYKISNI